MGTKISSLLFGLLLSVTAFGAQDALLSGTPIGSRYSVDYGNSSQPSTTVNTVANAFDGDLSTFFASWDRSRTWCGLDLGMPHVITRIGWSPRNDGLGPKRMVLGLFEGANDPAFIDAVPLFMIDQPGVVGEMHYADCEVTRGFRYVRYVGPADARCNVAEVAFYGHEGEGDDSHFHQLTNLPTLSFHTQDNVEPYDKEHDIASCITIIYADGTMIQEETGSTRLRGNASMQHPKKPYRIKLDESRHMFKGSDQRSTAKAKKWTLINHYDDKTLMRNLVAFEIARRMGMDYVPWSKPVDVIVNGEYRGCYQLTDQLTIDKNRINITGMEPSDTEGEALTGGYQLELDGYASQEVSWFNSAAGNPITIKSPSADEITTEQAQYIRREFNLMEAKILASNFDDPDFGYRSKLNAESLMRYFLTEDLAGNPDAFWSCYITKDRNDPQFRVGPVWDFDNAFDNDYRNFPTNDLGDFLSLARGGAGNSRQLLKRIFTDEVFVDSLRAMWNERRSGGHITAEGLVAYIDSTARELDQSQRLNFMKWPILDQKIQVNPRAGGSYEVEVGWIKEYTENRVAWLDRFINRGGEEEQIVVEIASAEQMKQFADKVNQGQPHLSARLMTDIDLSAYPSLIVGTSASGYTGEFDGNGHTVTLSQQRSSDHAGLFEMLKGHVHDLTVDGTIRTSKKYAAAIAGETQAAHIERCQSLVNITSTVDGDGTHGGIVGVTNTGTVIEDCLVACTIDGSRTSCCGGVVGWASGETTIRRCLVANTYNVSTSSSDELSRNATSVISTDNYYVSSWGAANDCHGTRRQGTDLTSGQICYDLNGRQPGSTVWHQTLNYDKTPVPDASHGIVYCRTRTRCDGTPYGITVAFTNVASQSRQDEHQYVDGYCSVCGAVNSEGLSRDERGYYEIATVSSLKWFAQMVENGRSDISAVLTADLDLTGEPSFAIGVGKAFAGTFDGAGHTITLRQVRDANYAGLFIHLSGTVQDLTVDGTITTSRQFAGGIASELLGGMLLRCQSYVSIQSSIYGDGTHGGLVGLISEANGISQIQDCIFAGAISGQNVNNCGGLVGWSSALGMISNSLMLGKMSITSDGGNMISRNPGNTIITDCYYMSNWRTDIPADARMTDEVDMATGALCCQLNGGRTADKQAWFQTLKEDPYPVPDRRHLPVWFYEGSYVNEDPDAVTQIAAEPAPSAAVYDLSGRRLTGQPAQGIYIMNNKKYVQRR